MCGIAGLFHLGGNSADPKVVEDMCRLIRHRGPDDFGVWSSGPAALGHRRLSIVDLSARGKNPMPNSDETLWLTANGEIYNHRDFRADLEKEGAKFRSDTDTEVLLHLYERRGPDFVRDLNGMFAFAIWDSKRRQLFLARDRFGVKPLYYAVIGGRFVFASEIKAFLGVPEFRAEADPYALAEHFAFQNTFHDRTFFKNVKLLPAGHTLTVSEKGIRENQYWDLRLEPESGLSMNEWAAGLRERFEAAVKRQLMSDVPLGSFLSGGMDTGAISALAARGISSMHTFTCGFETPANATALENFFDETAESFELASKLGTQHHPLRLGPEALPQNLAHVVWHLDEPRAGISYQVDCMARLTRQFVTVVLSGVGGDELFGGYPWRYESVLGLDENNFEAGYYRLWNRLLSDEERARLFTPTVKRGLGNFSPFESFRKVLEPVRKNEVMDQVLYFEFKTFLNGLLIVDDKLSMAHALEARVPFLDNELVDYARRIPWQFKYAAGQGKKVLREAMKGLLPDETLERRKQGFTPPDRTWYSGPLRSYVTETITGSRALGRGYFEPAALEKILNQHFSGQKDHRFLIWSLMGFEGWNRLFIDREPLPQGNHEAEKNVQVRS